MKGDAVDQATALGAGDVNTFMIPEVEYVEWGDSEASGVRDGHGIFGLMGWK
jgi:hypothetical protein